MLYWRILPQPVVITGASSGIGWETALYLSRRGFRVFAAMRDPSLARAFASGTDGPGGNVEVVQLDVTDAASIGKCVETITSRAGPVGAIVNNAGIQVRGYFEDLSDEDIRRVFETNVFGAMAFTRAMLPHVRMTPHGRIVLVTSVGGRIGSHGLSCYCSSKFALEGFGECLRLELAPLGIHVSMVEPGIINTDIWGKNKRVARRASDPSSPYRQLFTESEKWADWAVHTSPIKPVHVSEAIHKALTDRRPRMRYLVGIRPGFMLALRRLLPGETFDRIYCDVLTRKLMKAVQADGN